MERRIFIAINLPENLRQVLEEKYLDMRGLPARFTNPQNLHITLAFLGKVDDQGLVAASIITRNISLNRPSFEIIFNKIIYGPPKSLPPKMVWLTGDMSEEFSRLQEELQTQLADSTALRYEQERKENILHVTLARISAFGWRGIEPEESPQVEQDVNLRFATKSIDVMESKLKRGGPTYEVLESFKLS